MIPKDKLCGGFKRKYILINIKINLKLFRYFGNFHNNMGGIVQNKMFRANFQLVLFFSVKPI